MTETRTDEARAAAAARFRSPLPFTDRRREDFVAGAEWERERWQGVTNGLAENIREAIGEVRSWPNGPAYSVKRAAYDAELDALLGRAEALAALPEEA